MCRHADSNEPGGQIRDHDRPITAQGADSARAVRLKHTCVFQVHGVLISCLQTGLSSCVLRVNCLARSTTCAPHAQDLSTCSLRQQAVFKVTMQQVAEKLASRGWLPDLIMSSNSLRTRQTLQAMAEAVAAFGAAETHLLGSLYTVAALDGQTLKHLQARGHALFGTASLLVWCKSV